MGIRHQNWESEKAVLLIFSYIWCHFLSFSSPLLLYTVQRRVLCSSAAATLMIILPEPGLILCFSHRITPPCLSRELDFPGVVGVWVTLSIPIQPPQLPTGCPSQTIPALLCRAAAHARLELSWLFAQMTELPCEPVQGHSPCTGQGCHCQRAAVSQQCIFGSIWTLQFKDVPEVFRKSSGDVEHLNASLLTLWPDTVNKTWFDSAQLNLRG